MKTSWWPLHSVWMSASAGYNLGFWTPDNENWFQNRLADIRNGLAGPRSASEWRKDVKGSKQSLVLKRCLASAAMEAFNEVVS